MGRHVVTYRELLKLEGEPDPTRLLLFDGHSLAYRSFYAIPELSTRDGRPVNAIYGFWRILVRILRSFPSTYGAVVFDAGGKTFRHELYPAYKATRKAIPSDLAAQLPVIQELLRRLGVNVVAVEGVEADDLLASLACRAAEKGLVTYIATSDKDLAQLVGERILLLKPSGRGPEGGIDLLDAEKVKERFGAPPERIVDFLSLTGDSSDNVPGVPAVGEKTASALLAQFGSLDAVLERSDEVRNARVRENLKEHAADALLARRLIVLKEDLPVGDVLVDCRLEEVDVEGLGELLRELEFQSVLAELGLEAAPLRTQKKAAEEETVYRTILDERELDELVGRIAAEEEFSLDLETTSRDSMRAKIVGIAVSLRPYEGYYIPVGHDYLGAPKQLSLSHVLGALRPLIEGETPRIVGQNLKYELVVLERYGLHPRGIAFDTMIASHLARPEEPRHNLEEIARFYLNQPMLSYSELFGKEGRIAAAPLDQATPYAAADAEVVLRLKGPLEAALEEVGATRIFREVEVPLVAVLARMEQNGILLDQGILAAQGEEIRKRLRILEEDLYEIAGERFNPSSPKQVAQILFERLRLPVIERTKTGPSTSAHVLAKLAEKHPLPGKLAAYRELEKLLNTYIERLPEAVHPETGRIHTSFHQTSTATGRLSSSDPNLQNIPIRTEIGEKIRRAFVAPPGSLLIGADYSQIELRLLAHLSQDEVLIATFERGQDLHRLTASRIFAVPEEGVSPRLRDVAKRINFGIIYGISPYGLARELGIPQQEARAYIDRFFAAYPKAKEYIDRMIALATERGYAETLLGRRRPLRHLTSKEAARKNFDQRNAVNTPIQGSAADLIKLAMLQIDRSIEQGGLKAKMLLQIHDELVFEAKEEDVLQAMVEIKERMEHVMELRAPVEVKIRCGKDWSEI
jgi:DNA polymerase-1